MTAEAATGDGVGDRLMLRRSAIGGVAFVVLQLVSIILEGTPPKTDAPAADVTRYFHQHAGTVKVAELVGAVAMIGLLWWLVGWWRVARGSADQETVRVSVASIALSIALALALLHGALFATAALRADALGSQTLGLFILSYIVILTGGVGLFTFLILAVAVNRRTRAFPAWSDTVALISAAAFLLGTLGTASTATTLEVFGYLSFLAWCVWILAIAASLWGRARAALGDLSDATVAAG